MTTNEHFLGDVHDDWQAQRSRAAVKKLTSLIDPQRYVADLIGLDYDSASILIHDSLKNRVGGIPHGCLLLATRITPEEPEITDPGHERMALILLRVMGGIPLRSSMDLNRTREEAAMRASDTPQNYDESQHTDQFTLNMLRYAGTKCRILGTFRMYRDDDLPDSEWQMHFGGDLDSYYAGRGMKIYKPHGDALGKIVNYRASDASVDTLTRIGRLRYSAAIRDANTPESVPVYITADDMIAQRTALFGMTRSGKSNTTKIIASAIFKLRQELGGQRVGQLILDPNGEYANDNPQDQGCLRNVQYEVAGAEGEVKTYGSYKHPHDPDRNITKFNFYGEPEPLSFRPDQGMAQASLETLYQGKQIINDALSNETGGYVAAFIAADISGGNPAPSDSDYKRLRRRLFFYRAILADAGFESPPWSANAKGLFNKDLRTLMQAEGSLSQYVAHIESGSMSWDMAGDFSRAFAEWVKDNSFRNFDRQYAQGHDEGRNWSDTHLLGLLQIYDNTRGISTMQKTRVWHDLSSSSDYADTIVQQVRNGDLVIVDQLLGDPDMNRQAAERISRRLLEAQQRSFVNPKVDQDTGEVVKPPPVVIYAEEAHTLLPSSSEDDLDNIWAKLAKEGAKFNIGVVYSTQEPSSLQRNILTNTENWFIAHLSSTDETNQIRKYKDFADFTDGIVKVSETGLLRVRTLSRHYTIPVQIDLFTATPPQFADSGNSDVAQPSLIS
ncbi:MAG: DUF87 domain-containing protein [Dehalococcoidia bacterium]|nr:DUF87 domain-containing protein [Dehalococcoidia bacterium]